MSTHDPYKVLMSNLKYPDSNRLRAILENLLTPDQAQIVAALPGTIDEAAQKTGFDSGRVKKELDTLFFAGVVFPKGDFKDRQYFRFARSIGQFHDASQAAKGRDVVKDRAFYQLWHDFVMNEWYPDVGKLYAQAPQPRSRIVPAYNAIKDLPGILPCEDIRELFKAQQRIAVVPCSCRFRTTSVDEHCAHTAEEDLWHCIQLNRGADYTMAREAGKELNLEEAIALIDKIEADGLLHIWGNNASLAGGHVSCHCCRDCCMMAVPMDMNNTPLDKMWQKSRFIALVDQEACNGCQTCVDRCQFDAIEMVKPESGGKSKKRKATIDPEACYGCGVCVLGCDKTHALSMKLVRPPDHIPTKEG
ncbi:MAG: 4Fe-4S binding protein [Proteobacteria bacterium]|nr:4Fe-4S binding protein [Pseudomonadota bacterium]MBU4471707.1 4Fe-4S binding protein [Pseudomonadota bacterium]MCG2750681.1 4Fe-4S binding protein [Desulfobacteraceae bacterium]